MDGNKQHGERALFFLRSMIRICMLIVFRAVQYVAYYGVVWLR